MQGILGKLSVLTTSGELLKKLRSHIVRFASMCRSSPEFLQCIEKITLSMLESWKDQLQVLFHEEARKFMFTLTLKQVLSIEPEEPRALKILQDFMTFIHGFLSIPLNVPWTACAKAVKARK
ncbi:hypothetical protein Droror1_Dr00023188 [Drosera rotundifolia]